MAAMTLTILFCALLLAIVRAIWMASKWRSSGNVDESPAPLSDTFGDRLSDKLPTTVWPKTRMLFCVFAGFGNRRACLCARTAVAALKNAFRIW